MKRIMIELVVLSTLFLSISDGMETKQLPAPVPGPTDPLPKPSPPSPGPTVPR